VPKDSTLYWTVTDDGYGNVPFGVTGEPSDPLSGDMLYVNSEARSGKSQVYADTYHAVDVISVGDWTLTIKPND
jgi:hypothetical protein